MGEYGRRSDARTLGVSICLSMYTINLSPTYLESLTQRLIESQWLFPFPDLLFWYRSLWVKDYLSHFYFAIHSDEWNYDLEYINIPNWTKCINAPS